MSLVRCKKCRKEISSNASLCLNCGMICRKPDNRSKNRKLFSDACNVIGVVFVAAFLYNYFTSSPKEKAEKKESAFEESDRIYYAKKMVRDMLKDSDSAKFRNVLFHNAIIKGEQIPVVCGEVNSKNSFGAYAGFKRFVSAPPALVALEEQVSDFPKLWAQLCR